MRSEDLPLMTQEEVLAKFPKGKFCSVLLNSGALPDDVIADIVSHLGVFKAKPVARVELEEGVFTVFGEVSDGDDT